MTVSELQIKRKENGIRQDALARQLGWNAETIIDIERGRVQVSEHTLRQIDSGIEMVITGRSKLKREEVMA